jgi:hypothetical protein
MMNWKICKRKWLCFIWINYGILLGTGTVQWYSAGLRAGCSGVRGPIGAGNFSFHHRVQTGCGFHPASYPMLTRGSFPGVKRLKCEADHSHSSSAEVKNAWSYTSTHPIGLNNVVMD